MTREIPPGTRIRLLYMPDDPDPIDPGTWGTVRYHFAPGNPTFESVAVDWDNGRRLSVLPGVDSYVLEDEQEIELVLEDLPDND